MLEGLGLSRTADLVYARLIASSPATAEDLAESVGLDEKVVVAELDQLVAKGIVRLVGTAGSAYSAVSPISPSSRWSRPRRKSCAPIDWASRG